MRRATRFFIGVEEIGDIILCFSRGLRELGYPVTNLVWELKSPLLEREERHDGYIRRSKSKFVRQLRLLIEFLKHFSLHDIYVFNYCSSFTSELLRQDNWLFRSLAYIDLAILKVLKKKIVVIVNGDDLRSRPMLIEELRRDGLDQNAKYALQDLDMEAGIPDHIRRLKAAKICRYADHIFVRPMSAQLVKREYSLGWVPVIFDTFQFSLDQPERPVVVHAPSDSAVKGTRYVMTAVDRLKQEGYEFDFILCQNMANKLVREKLGAAQIAIDQLVLPSYGLFAVEAMASGCAVLGSAAGGHNAFPEDLPILTSTPDTIYQNLKCLLQDKALRIKLARDGRAYAEQWHDYRNVIRDFVRQIGCDGDS